MQLFKMVCSYFCLKLIEIFNGLCALKQHAKGAKHRARADALNEKPVTSEKSGNQQKLSNFFVKLVPVTPDEDSETTAGTSTECSIKFRKWLNVHEEVTKSEIVWALKSAKSNFTFESADNTQKLVLYVFPDSYSMSKTKMAYLYGHGLGPYFQDLTVKDIKVSDAYFTLHFDETVTKQAKKQLDVLLRFWSMIAFGYVKVCYLTSLFYGHAFAEKVSADLIQCLKKP